MSAGSSTHSSRGPKPLTCSPRHLLTRLLWFAIATCYCLSNALSPLTPINKQWPPSAFAQHHNTVSPSRNSLISTTTSERYPFAPARISQPAIATTPTTTTTGELLYGHNNSANNLIDYQQQPQPKSLKFTLTAGKFWKFNIKPNSLNTSHKDKELRLHRNISSSNFIIDDDGWFQYNHQQQQLFAWPSLNTKPATYYFVLLPSGIDFEADGENIISNSDIVANIMIELIRPLYNGPRFNIDQIIDHKFSLDYMHRHSAYPLLLNQIISIFETLTTRANFTANNTVRSSPTSTVTTLSSALQLHQQRSNRPSARLNEQLLIDSSYSPDGELFSITWSTHAALINNTVTTIGECRLASINDIVAKLSSPSLGYQSDSDKFVIYYSLEAPTVNSQAIAPTERGNYALKLILNGPCRKQKIIDDLGVAPSTSNILIGLTSDIDEEAKSNISDRQAPATKQPTIDTTPSVPSTGDAKVLTSTTTTTTTSTVSSVTNNPASTDPQNLDLIESNTAHDQQSEPQQDIVSSQTSSTSIETTTLPSFTRLALDINETTSPALLLATSISPVSPNKTTTATQTTINSPDLITHLTEPAITTSTSTPTPITSSHTIVQSGTKPTPTTTNNSFRREQTTLPSANEHTANNNNNKDQRAHNAQVFLAESLPSFGHQLEQQQQPQNQPSKPQAKSFANFLDLPQAKAHNHYYQQDSSSSNSTMFLVNPTTSSPEGLTPDIATTSSNMTVTSILNSVTNVPTTSTATMQETSINEDLIGILNEVMDYLTSIAVPASIIVGIILIASILIAILSLCLKRRKSKQFEVGNRFKFRYGSERRQFLKNSSKPVILEADQKSLSMGGTPQHKVQTNPNTKVDKNKATYLKMTPIKTDGKNVSSVPVNNNKGFKKNGTSSHRDGTNFFDMHMPGASHYSQPDGNQGGHPGGGVEDCGGGSGGDCGGGGD